MKFSRPDTFNQEDFLYANDYSTAKIQKVLPGLLGFQEIGDVFTVQTLQE